jgi:hypothetical protein
MHLALKVMWKTINCDHLDAGLISEYVGAGKRQGVSVQLVDGSLLVFFRLRQIIVLTVLFKDEKVPHQRVEKLLSQYNYHSNGNIT